MKRARILLGMLILAFCLPMATMADEAPSPEEQPARTSPLGVRQLRIKRMMQDMELKFRRVAATLEEAGEKERAEKLIEALQTSKQMLIENRMDEIVKLLNEKDLATATAEQQEVIKALKTIIDMLLQDEDEFDEIEERIKQLEEWRDRLQALRDTQQNHTRESEKIADKDQTLADLARRIKAVEGLIKQQEEVIERTAQQRAESGISGLDKVADEQKKVREQTEALADEIASAGKDPSETQSEEGEPSDGKPSDGKPSDGKPSDGKPSDGKPSDGKPSDGKPSDGKPSDGKPSDGKPSDGKPSDGKPSDGKPSDGKPSSGDPSQSSEPGASELAKASDHQKDAEGKLDEGKGKAAQDAEQQALVELEKALEELKQEKSRIASLPKEVFDELAKKQDRTEADTSDLAKEMEKANQKDSQSGGQPSDGQPSDGQPSDGQPSDGQQQQKQPGQKQVQQAQKSMQQGSDDLKQQNPDDAAKDQDDAAKELQKALEEIEQRLAQLREEMQLERLARLEARFREMLARQQIVTLGTATLDEKKKDSPTGRLSRRDGLSLKKYVEEELALSESAQQALEIILEDGTSVVFPRVVEQLRDDLARVSGRLEEEQTGGYTHVLQKDIEAILEELIEALKKAQQQKQAGQGGQQGGGGNPNENNEPLLPNSAELKMLKSMQLRVNSRTKAFDTERVGKDFDDKMRQEVANISDLQRDVAEMTLEIVER